MHLDMKITQALWAQDGQKFLTPTWCLPSGTCKTIWVWKQRTGVYCQGSASLCQARHLSKDSKHQHSDSWNLITCSFEESSTRKRILRYRRIAILLKYVSNNYILHNFRKFLEPILFPFLVINFSEEWQPEILPQKGRASAYKPAASPCSWPPLCDCKNHISLLSYG